jgi:PadR family transcriptional regulator, regulatory protein PadR
MPSFLGMDLRGHLDLLLLATLRRTGPVHGYALITALREKSGGAFDLPEGTVYPALHRLERDGSIASSWDTSAPRRRRVYTLTTVGATALADKRTVWNTFVTGVQAVLDRRTAVVVPA